MKDDPSRVPTPPITLQLRDRVAEIIAERPSQQLTWELSGELGKIIAERIADLPLEQRTEVAQLTILETLIIRTDVELIGLVRRHVALELARLWTKKEWAEIERQREQYYLESMFRLAKLGRKTKVGTKVGAPKPARPSALAILKNVVQGQIISGRALRFQSTDALKQFLKRGRRAKKKPRL
jgi:hypothetical protein